MSAIRIGAGPSHAAAAPPTGGRCRRPLGPMPGSAAGWRRPEQRPRPRWRTASPEPARRRAHLVDALHAWCGAHSLRDLRAVWEADPAGQAWAGAMADLLVYANKAAGAARAAGARVLDRATLARIVGWYRGAAAKRHRRQPAAADPACQGRAAAGPPVWRPRGDDPAVCDRPCRRLHQQPGRTRHPAGQGPATSLGWLLADPARAGRLGHRVVLPVHCRQVGVGQAGGAAPAVCHRALAAAGHRPGG
jgi:hypothetical protein